MMMMFRVITRKFTGKFSCRTFINGSGEENNERRREGIIERERTLHSVSMLKAAAFAAPLLAVTHAAFVSLPVPALQCAPWAAGAGGCSRGSPASAPSKSCAPFAKASTQRVPQGMGTEHRKGCARRHNIPMMCSPTAAESVRGLYEAYNCRDIDAVMSFFDADIEYQNGNFPKPFIGKEAVRRLFSKSCESLPSDMIFVLDEITEDDLLRVGILWHIEVDGKVFPGSDGVSFYKINKDNGKLIFARTLVEPVLKPAFSVFPLLGLMGTLVRNGIYK